VAGNAGMGLANSPKPQASGRHFPHPHFVIPSDRLPRILLFLVFAMVDLIGRSLAVFVAGLITWQLLASAGVPSIRLGLWFSVLVLYHLNGIGTEGFRTGLMEPFVGPIVLS